MMLPESVKIDGANNGFIVKCGCATLVTQDTNELLSWLGKYLTNPQSTLKDSVKMGWVKDVINEAEPIWYRTCTTRGKKINGTKTR